MSANKRRDHHMNTAWLLHGQNFEICKNLGGKDLSLRKRMETLIPPKHHFPNVMPLRNDFCRSAFSHAKQLVLRVQLGCPGCSSGGSGRVPFRPRRPTLSTGGNKARLRGGGGPSLGEATTVLATRLHMRNVRTHTHTPEHGQGPGSGSSRMRSATARLPKGTEMRQPIYAVPASTDRGTKVPACL